MEVLSNAAYKLEELSKYSKNQTILRQQLQGVHSATLLRLEHAQARDGALGYLEVKVAMETLSNLLSPPNKAVGDFALHPNQTPAALGLLSVARNLVLLIGSPLDLSFAIIMYVDLRKASAD